ncbi:hypothetical protein GTP45_10730 [Pseudoduganella sp. FT55W]|uniref:Uncharacterized protein n=1 Tax=Duganella rivi TaxID=2666083 RepID=A0A7X4GPI1_9BURK|nr:hypothetical protein [Duganella rivi]MYM67305.1 hypothetical protein [Duganella rivi]
MSVTQDYKKENSLAPSTWRVLRRIGGFEAESAKRAIQHRKELRAALVSGKTVDDVHNLQGQPMSHFVIRRMDGDKFAKLKADMAQARNDRIALCTHIPSDKKVSSLAALKNAACVVAGCLLLMSGPILSAFGVLKG